MDAQFASLSFPTPTAVGERESIFSPCGALTWIPAQAFSLSGMILQRLPPSSPTLPLAGGGGVVVLENSSFPLPPRSGGEGQGGGWQRRTLAHVILVPEFARDTKHLTQPHHPPPFSLPTAARGEGKTGRCDSPAAHGNCEAVPDWEAC